MARRIPVDHRTDIYSLGATMYEALTLRPPFQGKNAQATLSEILFRDPEAPRRRNPRVPRDLETVVLKCLRKDPGDRYGTAEALAQDLRRFLRGDPIEARPQPAWERISRKAWRNRGKLTAACLGSSCLRWRGSSERALPGAARGEGQGVRRPRDRAITKMELGKSSRAPGSRSGPWCAGLQAGPRAACSSERIRSPRRDDRAELTLAASSAPGRDPSAKRWRISGRRRRTFPGGPTPGTTWRAPRRCWIETRKPGTASGGRSSATRGSCRRFSSRRGSSRRRESRARPRRRRSGPKAPGEAGGPRRCSRRREPGRSGGGRKPSRPTTRSSRSSRGEASDTSAPRSSSGWGRGGRGSRSGRGGCDRGLCRGSRALAGSGRAAVPSREGLLPPGARERAQEKLERLVAAAARKDETILLVSGTYQGLGEFGTALSWAERASPSPARELSKAVALLDSSAARTPRGRRERGWRWIRKSPL